MPMAVRLERVWQGAQAPAGGLRLTLTAPVAAEKTREERAPPSRCIHIEATGRAKERVLTRFDIEMDKCQYCGLCVEVCPTEAIVFVPHYEASTYNRANLLYDLEDLHRAAPKEPIARGVIRGKVL